MAEPLCSVLVRVSQDARYGGYTASKAQTLDELLAAGFDGLEARLPLQADCTISAHKYAMP